MYPCLIQDTNSRHKIAPFPRPCATSFPYQHHFRFAISLSAKLLKYDQFHIAKVYTFATTISVMCADPTVPSRNFVPHPVTVDDFPIGFAADAEPSLRETRIIGSNPAYMLIATTCTGAAVNVLVNGGVETAPCIGASFKVHWVSRGNGVCDSEASEKGEEEDGRKLHLCGNVVKGSSIWALMALRCYVLYLLGAV